MVQMLFSAFQKMENLIPKHRSLDLTCLQSDPMFRSHQQVFRYFQLCRFVNLRENVNSTVQMLFSLISLQSFNLRTRSSGRTKSTVRFVNPHSNGTTIFTRVI